MLKSKKSLWIMLLVLLVPSTLIIFSVVSQSDAEEQVINGDITYTFAWDWENAEPHADGGWLVENDLGYRIHVETGYVVSYSLQMLPCEQASTEQSSLWQPVQDLLGVQTAYAGHGGDEFDPSHMREPMIEDLASPSAVQLDAITVPQQHYCTAHYLIARATHAVSNLPSGVDLVGASIYFSGTYITADSVEPMPFVLQTGLANGVIATFVDYNTDTIITQAIAGTTPLNVTVQRHLDTLFDGVDFGNMADDELSRTILWNLIADTQILVDGEIIQ